MSPSASTLLTFILHFLGGILLSDSSSDVCSDQSATTKPPVVVAYYSDFSSLDKGRYRELGSTVVLSPGPVDAPVTSVTWKHGASTGLHWSGQDVTCCHPFTDHCTLNKSTGDFIIRNVTPEHSGRYRAEVNGRVGDDAEIQVVSPVSKPTLTTSCNAEKTSCDLTCEGDTEDNGPVNFMMSAGDMGLMGRRTMTITGVSETWFSCTLKNPISWKHSEYVLNPLIPIKPGVDYRKLGSTVLISPGPVTGPVTHVEWTRGWFYILSWSGGEITSFHPGNCVLNTSTGDLIIRNLTAELSGIYMATINYRKTFATEIKVISPVPKPTVSTRCNAQNTSCLLTCEGDITDDNGPVDVSWTVGDRRLPGNKTLNITQSWMKVFDLQESDDIWISCGMKNPVSSERSKDVIKPFITGEFPHLLVPGLENYIYYSNLAKLVVVLILAGVFVTWHVYKGLRKNGPDPMKVQE